MLLLGPQLSTEVYQYPPPPPATRFQILTANDKSTLMLGGFHGLKDARFGGLRGALFNTSGM